MKFKDIRCFFEEVMVFAFCVTLVCVVFIKQGDVDFDGFPSVFIVTSLVSIILWVFLFSRTIRIGVASFLDFVFQKIKKDVYLVTGKQEICSTKFVLCKETIDNDYVEFVQKNTKFEVYKLTWNISKFREMMGEPTFSYLILCDFQAQISYEQMLDNIEQIDQKNRKSKDIVCVLKEENPLKEKCFWFNGKDFCHFMFVSPSQKKIVKDTDFSYNSCKQIKKQMEIVENVIQRIL